MGKTTPKPKADTTTASETEEDKGPKNGEEYLAAVGRGVSSPATMGDVIGMLQYFGGIPQPADHAPTPFSRTE